ncbi:MAG: YicC/YloC family endoribonuclease [Planctomycetia bacterium]
MSLSMTGCGEGVATDGPNSCRVELRTVNNRFFKLSLRAQEAFTGIESQIEAAIRKRVQRGSVQMTLDVSGPMAPGVRRLDRRQLEAYLDDLEDFCATHDIAVPQSVDALLGLPGTVVESKSVAGAAPEVWPLVERAIDAALDRLDAMRRAEGETLSTDMRAICGSLRSLAAGIADRVPAAVEEHRARLHERVLKLLETQGTVIAPGDLAREVALIADRSDVAEELVRLESHVGQFERLLGEEAPGRSLDFLSQELAREANTIASKSADVAIAHAVVEMKTRIERLREQVQNIA